MDKRSYVSLIALLVLTFQAACGALPIVLPTALPAAPLAPTSPAAAPSTAAPTVAPTVAPTAVEPTAPATATEESTAPPLLAMEIGSVHSYFDGSLLVPVPAGPFIMGGGGSDNPVHTVYLSDYWIYSTEVTNRMYSLCVAAGKCSPPNAEDNSIYSEPLKGDRPVVGVDWQQASAYCDYAHARLPTEAEWEKAARGPNGPKFPWGNDPPSCDLLNFGPCLYRTTEVGLYPNGASDYGALDMAGNVFEWVADWHVASYYGAAPTQDPLGPETGTKRSVRSSSFQSDGYLTEVARRSSASPADHRADLGFRCVVEDPTYFSPFCTTPPLLGRTPVGVHSHEGIVEPQCSQVTGVTQVHFCISKKPWTNVIINTEGGVVDMGSLSNCGDPQETGVPGQVMYTCEMADDPGRVRLCGNCTVAPETELSCIEGYELVGGQCVLKRRWLGQCPEGAAYDPAQECCTASGSIRSIYDLNCPSGLDAYEAGGSVFCGHLTISVCTPVVVTWRPCGDNRPDCEPGEPGCEQPGPCTGQQCGPPPNCGPNDPPCQYCLSAQALIDAPGGAFPVEALKAGDLVWTVDAAGMRVVAPILRVARTPVLASHEMVHLVVADGRELLASPGHPTADGRTLGDLKIGDTIDGAAVTLTERVAYDQPATYDLLPAGDTGFYWADGILLGSTLSGQ